MRDVYFLVTVLLVAACSGDSSEDPIEASAGGGAATSSGDAGDGASAAAGDSWGSYAEGFFATYCIACHGAGNATRDYTVIDQVRRDQDAIRCGVATEPLDGCGAWPPPNQFPIGGGPKPSDDERNRLVAWIEADAP